MRINEFTSAEDQLALVKLIFDNTWAALSKQAADQRTKATLPRTPAKAKRPSKPRIPAPPKPKPPKPVPKPAIKAEPQQAQRFSTATSPKQPASVTPQNTSNTSFDAFSNRSQLAKKSIDKIDDRHSSNGDTNLKKLLRIFQQVST